MSDAAARPGRGAGELSEASGTPKWGVRDLLPFGAMVVGVVAAGVLPFVRFRQFYLAGDSIAQWLPVSRRIGQLVTSGESHLMDPSMWRGGNFVAEARFGVWNPVAVLLDATVLQLDDLSVAAMLVNLVYLVILATGAYLLAREYAAAAWPAALAGLAAATGGWTLWMDASWWTPHLASFSFAPFVWIAARRLARGVGSPAWVVLAGALCVTAGNPYSNVVVGVIAVAAVVEFGDREHPAPQLALAGSMVAIALIAIFVYVPFRQTSGVGFRETGIFNDGSWAPSVGDLFVMSTPTAAPGVRNFGRNNLGFPGSYIAWFVVPLAPWIRWRTLVHREVAGLAVFGGVFLVLLLGPSNLWFFRWPMRLIPYVALPIVIGFAVALGSGLARDRYRKRIAVSAGLIVATAYLAWADLPDDLAWHLSGSVAILVVMVAVIECARRHADATVPAMMLAVVVVLGLQLLWRPSNESVRHFAMPGSAATYESLADRYDGTVVQIASYDDIPPGQRNPDGAYRDLALGSALAIGNVEAVSSYSGIGFSTHDAALCLDFDGSTCARAWSRLWQPAEPDGPVLADLFGADTVVVQRSLIDTDDAEPPDGWSRDDTTDAVVVWKRDGASGWPEGRLSDVTGPIVIDVTEAAGPHRETVRFRRSGEGSAQLTFARLAWPGYVATIDDRSLLVGGGPAGLLTVTIPDDVGDGEVVLTWTPPYWRPSLLVLCLGVMVGVVTQLVWWRSRRRQPSATS